MSATAQRATTQRYSPSMQTLHWLIALLMFAALPLAWTMTALPRTAPDREFWYTLHKSTGITILALAAIRLAIRTTRPIPPEPADTPHWMALAARVSHWSLYAILFIMPISGYIVSSAGGNPVSWFGLFDLPAIPRDQALQAAARTIHRATRWAVYALITLHLAATAYHVVIRRDGILDRELPPQRP